MREELKGTEVVIVVEDEPGVRAPIARFLRNLGYFVLEASNGEDALGVMQEYGAPVHLVITDLNMPTMSGSELVDQLRSWYPGMRVLFMSGGDPNGIDARGAELTGSAFVRKPFTLEGMGRTVRELLDSDWQGEPEES